MDCLGGTKLGVNTLFLYKPALMLGLQYLSRDTKSKAKPSSDSGIGRHLWLSNKREKVKDHFVPKQCFIKFLYLPLLSKQNPQFYNSDLNAPVKLKHYDKYIHIQTPSTPGLHSLLNVMFLITSSRHEPLLHTQEPRTLDTTWPMTNLFRVSTMSKIDCWEARGNVFCSLMSTIITHTPGDTKQSSVPLPGTSLSKVRPPLDSTA